MREHVRLGRIAGIDVGINWSVLAIFLLITFGLAAGRFPARFPDLAPAAYIAAGLVAGVLFFGSLLAHEVAHAVVAERRGVEIEGITLWLFGGVARMKGEPANARDELHIAGVGPLVSLLLSAAFFAVSLVLEASGSTGLAQDVFVWLGAINLVLAVFNLAPAAPLDGGRILRAALWRWRGDRNSAAITAARAGRGFGWALIVLGFLQLVSSGFGGIWLMLIGWFLSTVASAEETQAKAATALGDVRVADVMSPDPTTVPATLAVEDFVYEYVFPHHYNTFPVVDDSGDLVGLITLRRVKTVPVDERETTLVRDVACRLEDVPVVGPDTSLADLLPRMTGCSGGRTLVVDGDRLVGLVSPTDIMRRLEVAELTTLRRRSQHI